MIQLTEKWFYSFHRTKTQKPGAYARALPTGYWGSKEQFSVLFTLPSKAPTLQQLAPKQSTADGMKWMMMQRKPLGDAKCDRETINRLRWLTLASMHACDKESQTIWSTCCARLMVEWWA